MLARYLEEQPPPNKCLRLEFKSFLLEFLFWESKIKLQESYSHMCMCSVGV